jgi:hypothetical protein
VRLGKVEKRDRSGVGLNASSQLVDLLVRLHPSIMASWPQP